MLKKTILFPIRGENVIVRNIVGGTLLLYSVFLVPALPLCGYLLRVLDASLADDDSPPSFENWTGLTVDGLKVVAIAFGYSLVPTALYVVGAFGYFGSGESAIGGGVALFVALVAVLASLVANYLIPAALANFVREGALTAAFDAPTIKQAAFTKGYFLRAAVFPVVLGILALVVAGGLTALTLGVGLLFLPFVSFYLYSCLFYVFGRAFVGSVAPSEDEDSVETPASDPLA